MLIKTILYDFVSDNIYIILLYFIIVLFTFPIESVILPRFYSKLFESLRNSKNNKKNNLFTNILKNILTFNSLGIIWTIIIIWLFVVLFLSLKLHIESIIIPDYLSYIRKIIFSKTILRHKDNYEDIRVGEHISRVMDLSRNMKDSLHFILNSFIPVFLGIIIIIIYFFNLDFRIGLSLLIGVFLTLIIYVFFGNRCINFSSEREEYYLLMNEKLHDSFGNLMNIYINNKSYDEIKNNNDIENKHTELYKKQLKASGNLNLFSQLISYVTFSIVLLFSYKLFLNNNFTSTVLISIIITLIYYLGYLLKISNELPSLFLKIGVIKQSESFLKNLIRINKSLYKNNIIKYSKVTYTNVNFKYPKTNRYVLKNFNLTIKSGTKTAIIGQSGSGKSTIMKLLIQINYHESGTIKIDDVNIRSIPLNELRTNITYINQKTGLFNDTIINNIKYGNYVNDDFVIDLLKKYDLNSVYSGLTKGIYNIAGVHGGNLSPGMQKITLLLRGVLKKSKIIIFDEPLAGIDYNTRKNVIKMINDIALNKKVIVITHDTDILPHMDEIIDLNKLL